MILNFSFTYKCETYSHKLNHGNMYLIYCSDLEGDRRSGHKAIGFILVRITWKITKASFICTICTPLCSVHMSINCVHMLLDLLFKHITNVSVLH